MNISIVVNNKECVGCGNCSLVCPKNIIKIRLNKEGFFQSYIHKSELCIKCGKCVIVSPVFTTNGVANYNRKEPITFAAWSNDECSIIKSSSGGIFFELAKYVLNIGGYICGAIYDSEFHVKHIVTNKISDLEKMRGSKYLQSDFSNSIQQCLKIYEKNIPVLIVGTPCQIAAIKLYLKFNRIDFKNSPIYLIDLICHGVASYKVFDAYKTFLERKMKSSIVSINFRFKEPSWNHFSIKIEFENGKIYKKLSEGKNRWQKLFCEDWFFKGFLRDLYLNSPCYKCKFAKLPREGDITLGDFWGVPGQYYNEKGVSVVLINNIKGEELFNKITNNIKYFNVDLERAMLCNPRIYCGTWEKKRCNIEDINDFNKLRLVILADMIKSKIINIKKSLFKRK